MRDISRLDTAREVYMKTLVHLYRECIVINLTEDYFLDCRNGDFTQENMIKGTYSTVNEWHVKHFLHPKDQKKFQESFSRAALLRQYAEGDRYIRRRMRMKADENSAYRMHVFIVSFMDLPGESDAWCVMLCRDAEEEYQRECYQEIELHQMEKAVRETYDTMFVVNLTQNKYHQIERDCFLKGIMQAEGNFDEMMEDALKTMAPESRETFRSTFFRKPLLEAFAAGKEKISIELRQLGDDGEYHWNFSQVVRIDSPYNDDILEITLVRNIDKERRQQEETLERERQAKQILEEALEQAKAGSHAKSAFLSRMSHDIRTPLNGIMGMATLAGYHLDEPEKLQEYLNQIMVSGEHLLGLINEVLDMSRIESGRLELKQGYFHMMKVIEDAATIVQPALQRRNVQLVMRSQGRLDCEVYGDAQRLRQVCVNILDNAIKYSHDGGRVDVLVEHSNSQESGRGVWRIVIEDYGIGIKKDYLQHIFEPFSRAADTRVGRVVGTGLGLTIVKNFIELMGGTLEVTSEYGSGSCFVVNLELPERANETSREINQTEKADEKSISTQAAHQTQKNCSNTEYGLHILLVEDNEMNRDIVTEMLRLMGCTVEAAENGQEAVDKVLRNEPDTFDLVLMDIQMPVMNGYDAVRIIRGCGYTGMRDLQIVALTADAFEEDIRKTRQVGMNGHLAKPINIQELRNTLERVASHKM